MSESYTKLSDQIQEVRAKAIQIIESYGLRVGQKLFELNEFSEEMAVIHIHLNDFINDNSDFEEKIKQELNVDLGYRGPNAIVLRMKIK